ncbi:hypothetical protein A9995_06635 [Erythrobacter sp. QSSC1-22B]|nr:hypothetical protein A9995_06635 [Erythrobacter sp. QSSC1-22B]
MAYSLEVFRRWWRIQVIETVDQPAVIAARREEAYNSPRFLFMLAMSAGIAILGMLLSSPAVVIGAMLIAPLIGPIIGAGFALAIGDYGWLAGSVRALVAGTALGVGLTALIVFVSPLQTITPEIAARTQPNLFDLGVAVFSALAGAYAMIRGREGTIVGVAIATALMPPLAAVGFGLATANWTVFWGASLLYITNLMTIALVATLMARLYGFSHTLSERQTNWQTVIIVVIFIALATPLFFSLRQIVWETNAARQIRATLVASFESQVRISEIDFNLDAEPITVEATVLTPETSRVAERLSEESLTALLARPVDLELTQFLVGTEAEAETAEIAAASARERRDEVQQARELGARLAMLAGVEAGAVTIDRDNRRAIVRASGLGGAGLATFRAIEQRVADNYPDWNVELIPPLSALPTIPFADGEPTAQGLENLELAAWAAQRLGLPLALEGGSVATRETAAEILSEAGVEPQLIVGGPVMQARWATAPEE